MTTIRIFRRQNCTTQPVGGGAQARIAKHLSAGAPTSAGDHDTSATNKTSEKSPPLYAMLISTEIKYCQVPKTVQNTDV